ncbi:hypothetical protein QYF36_024450 [Acer negundo]|nr:hypothetical protein QYF36_024450 [Acer negundo]
MLIQGLSLSLFLFSNFLLVFSSDLLFFISSQSFTETNLSSRPIYSTSACLICFKGGPMLRKWYGSPDLIPKDEWGKKDQGKDEDEYPDNQ